MQSEVRELFQNYQKLNTTITLHQLNQANKNYCLFFYSIRIQLSLMVLEASLHWGRKNLRHLLIKIFVYYTGVAFDLIKYQIGFVHRNLLDRKYNQLVSPSCKLKVSKESKFKVLCNSLHLLHSTHINDILENQVSQISMQLLMSSKKIKTAVIAILQHNV